MYLMPIPTIKTDVIYFFKSGKCAVPEKFGATCTYRGGQCVAFLPFMRRFCTFYFNNRMHTYFALFLLWNSFQNVLPEAFLLKLEVFQEIQEVFYYNCADNLFLLGYCINLHYKFLELFCKLFIILLYTVKSTNFQQIIKINFIQMVN